MGRQAMFRRQTATAPCRAGLATRSSGRSAVGLRPDEEHYLTSPRAKVQKTLILHPVRKR